MNIFVLLSMFFAHIIDDFFLQTTWLSNGKQREWWEKVAPEKLYRYDYLAALAIHSYSWSFMTLSPIATKRQFDVNGKFVIVLIVNAIIHGIVDDTKANKHKINLVVDQAIHIVQIFAAFFILK